MITWNNLDTLESFKELSNVKKVNLVEAMTGRNVQSVLKIQRTDGCWSCI